MTELPDGIFRQKVACADCPFRKEGGVRHSREMMLDYISYFLSWPGATFPCHKSVPKEEDRTEWGEWKAGQVLCAGGIIFAMKHGHLNGVMAVGLERGLLDPGQYSKDAREAIFDGIKEMLHGTPVD